MYGIWNDIDKRFVFGISENTKSSALLKFSKVNPKGRYCHRYNARKIPEGWKNPSNKLYERR